MEVPIGESRDMSRREHVARSRLAAQTMSPGSSKVQGSGWTRNDFGPAQKDYSGLRDPGRIDPCFDSQRELRD